MRILGDKWTGFILWHLKDEPVRSFPPDLPRLKPSPLPAIHPGPEYFADDTLKTGDGLAVLLIELETV